MSLGSGIADATTVLSATWGGVVDLMSNPIIAVGIGLVFVSLGVTLFYKFVNRAKK